MNILTKSSNYIQRGRGVPMDTIILKNLLCSSFQRITMSLQSIIPISSKHQYPFLSTSNQCDPFSSLSKPKSKKFKSKLKKKTIKNKNHNPKNLKNHHHPLKQKRIIPTKSKSKSNTTNNKIGKEAPPLFLYSTASPYVYVASIAIDNSYAIQNQQDEEENYGYEEEDQEGDDNDVDFINPKSLFSEINPPLSFSNSSFEYISPKLFNYELPSSTSSLSSSKSIATYSNTNNDTTIATNLIPEIAFLGRSNVGKSSLLNALTGIKDLARISKTPGRTQQINYFGQFRKDGGVIYNSKGILGEEKRYFVSNPPIGYIIDLPGYGMY